MTRQEAAERRPAAPDQSAWRNWIPCSAIRALASILIMGSGLACLAITAVGVPMLFGPPAQAVTTVTGMKTMADTPAWNGPEPLLLAPLGFAGTTMAGLALLWAGIAGLRTFRSRRTWLVRQATSVVGYVTGATVFTAAFLVGDDAVRTDYLRSVHQALDLVPRYLLPLLLILTVAVLGRGVRIKLDFRMGASRERGNPHPAARPPGAGVERGGPPARPGGPAAASGQVRAGP